MYECPEFLGPLPLDGATLGGGLIPGSGSPDLIAGAVDVAFTLLAPLESGLAFALTRIDGHGINQSFAL
jgi:hypothetical protein